MPVQEKLTKHESGILTTVGEEALREKDREDEILRLFEKPQRYAYPYLGHKGCLYMAHGNSLIKLCNFTPWISLEIVLDDGQEIDRMVAVTGTMENGAPLPEIRLAARDLNRADWILDKWGVQCILDVGRMTAAHVRKAIQITAEAAPKQTIFTTTGWKKLGGAWDYLLPGSTNCEIQVEERLKGYAGADQCTAADLMDTFSMIGLELAPKKVLLPLLAFAFLTPLNHFLKEADCEPKFTLFLLGHTGSRKSTLAALMLSFFGQFTGAGLPLSFQDTANSILYYLFQAKDVLLAIDDFHPDAPGSTSRMNATAQTIMRAYGDRVGKGRLTERSQPMHSRPPQGNAILTGEFPPDIGESGSARYFPVELHPGDVDLEVLSLFQEAAADGLLRRCLYGYTQWIRKTFLSDDKHHGGLVDDLRRDFEMHRTRFTRSSGTKCHGRLPEMMAWLTIGLEFFFRFLREEEAVPERELTPLTIAFEEILFQAARSQAQAVDREKPALIFVRKLISLLESGQGVVLPRRGGSGEKPKGFLGYEDAEYYYLHPDAVHKAVKQLCAEQGELFSVSANGLKKALREEGLILPGKNQNTRTVSIGNRSPRMLWLNKERVRAVLDRMD